MRKWIVIALSISLIILLCACSQQSTGDASKTQDSMPESKEPSSSQAAS